MFIYGIYRLDHMSLRVKLFQFITSAVDTVKYTVQGTFKKKKKRKNSTNLNT